MHRTEIADLIAGILPFDAAEAEHRDEALAWVRSDAEIYRRQKPDVPAEHLVAYFAVVDVDAGAMLLVDHINAQRWLPTGGHVEPDEDPRDTVTRELQEELGITAPLVADLSSNPILVTRTRTRGIDNGHIDVSLWYVIAASTDVTVTPDPGEFHAIRWWSFAEIHAAPSDTLDPNLSRFVTKLARDLRRG